MNIILSFTASALLVSAIWCYPGPRPDVEELEDSSELEEEHIACDSTVPFVPGDPISPDEWGKKIEIGVRNIGGSKKPAKAEQDTIGKRQRSLGSRSAINDYNFRWPGGIIPYEIDYTYSEYHRIFIASAMSEYHTKTCIRFKEHTTENHWIRIRGGRGCVSWIGHREGCQDVILSDGCMNVGIIVHELMHAVGFTHEQERPDRDEFIDIKWNNIIRGMEDNFEKCGEGDCLTFNTTYDYGSLMHYAPTDFASNPSRPAFTPKKPVDPSIVVGQRNGFSKSDIYRINKLYHCDATHAHKGRITDTIKCEDRNKMCHKYVKQTDCSEAYMMVNCPKSCNHCDGTCKDTLPDCPDWAERGECKKRASYMSRYCPKSCSTCVGSTDEINVVDLAPGADDETHKLGVRSGS